MNVSIAQISAALDAWAPPALAESYDNVGLHVGRSGAEVSSVLVALEITRDVIEEAARRGANLIVSHHPIWFRPRKHLRGDDFVSRCILLALRHEIALFALHTNLDNVRTGVNARIAERLGLTETRILKPLDASGETGAGLVGRLPEPMPEADFRRHVRHRLEAQALRYAPGPAVIERVALCGGAGSFLIETALRSGADAYVTGDVSHHYFFEPEGKMLLVDPGHFETEQYTANLIHEYLCAQFPILASMNRLLRSECYTNPVRYDWEQ